MPRIEGDTQKKATYSIKECVQWYLKYKLEKAASNNALTAVKIRKMALEADMIELNKKEKLGELIAVASVVALWESIFAEFRTSILTIPKKITAIYDSFRSQYDLETALNNEMFYALDNLSRINERLADEFNEVNK